MGLCASGTFLVSHYNISYGYIPCSIPGIRADYKSQGILMDSIASLAVYLTVDPGISSLNPSPTMYLHYELFYTTILLLLLSQERHLSVMEKVYALNTG